MKKYLLLLLFVTTGCATTQNYEKILASWIGAPESALIANWGPPNSSYQISANSKVITYTRGRNVQVGGFATTTPVTTTTSGNIYGSVNANYSSTATTYIPTVTPVTNIAMTCSTRFTINNGVIASWAWEGNDCKANEPPPVVITNANQAEVQKKYDEIRNKIIAICNLPELVEYYKKTACNSSEINFAHITDTSKITEAQKEALVKQRITVSTVDKMQDDLQAMRGIAGQKITDIAKSFVRPENEKNALDLYNGLITWGEYNKKRKEIFLEISTRMSK